MKITIEIPTGMYKDIRNGIDGYNNYICTAIRQGVPSKKPKIKAWIDKDASSAVCPYCNRNNLLYGNYCKWCGKEVEGEIII